MAVTPCAKDISEIQFPVGVPIIRIIVFWGLDWAPHFWKLPVIIGDECTVYHHQAKLAASRNVRADTSFHFLLQYTYIIPI